MLLLLATVLNVFVFNFRAGLMGKKHSPGVFELEFTTGYCGVGGCIADFLPGAALEIARCCCAACSHDSHFVPIISGNALWLCECFVFREEFWLQECP